MDTWLNRQKSIYLLRFQSHQIFHVLVVAAAFVHYTGMKVIAVHRLTEVRQNYWPDIRHNPIYNRHLVSLHDAERNAFFAS